MEATAQPPHPLRGSGQGAAGRAEALQGGRWRLGEDGCHRQGLGLLVVFNFYLAKFY